MGGDFNKPQLSPYKLDYPPNMDFHDSDSLRFVIGLMTHLHNPAAYRLGDQFDKEIKGQVDDLKTNAYALMNGLICDIVKRENSVWWNSGWSHYMTLGQKALETAKKEYGETLEDHLDAIDNWAIDTMKLRCSVLERLKKDFVLN